MSSLQSAIRLFFLIFKQFHLVGEWTPCWRKVTTRFYWKVSSTVMVFYSGVGGVCLSILSGWVDQCAFKSVCLLAGWMLGCGSILVSTWETQQGTSSHYQIANSTKYWVGIFICNYDVLNHFRQVFWPQQQNSLPYNFNHNCTMVNISTIYNIQSTNQ